MNNEDFYSADFTNSLPPALKNDPDMMALAQTISAQLQTTAAEVRKNIIYARIDELDEATCWLTTCTLTGTTIPTLSR